jgi:hypothetical protein
VCATSWREWLGVQEPRAGSQGFGSSQLLALLEALARRLFLRFHLVPPCQRDGPRGGQLI